MRQSQDRILTTHTGSLPRPVALTESMHRHIEGLAVDAEAMAEEIAGARSEVVAQQLKAGIDVISDGEASKPSYVTYVADRFEGFGGQGDPLVIAEFADYPEVAVGLAEDPGMKHAVAPACIGPVRLRDTDAVHADIAAFGQELAQAPDVEGFMTAPSPGAIAMYMVNRHYASDEEYLYALADAMRHEYAAIVGAGLILQIDCPDIGCAGHGRYAHLDERDLLAAVRTHVQVLDHAVDGLPADRIRMHVCWGNYPSTHHRDVELRQLAPTILAAAPQGLLLEAANPRHAHEWAVLEELGVPDGKVLIPGVIDSTTNYIEHPELIAQRILAYARIVGRENVLAGSDCGFGTITGLRWVQPRVVWAKLEALVEGARIASTTLWK